MEPPFLGQLWNTLADRVITASSVVADDLGLPLAEDNGKLHVIPWGVDDTFCAQPPDNVIDEVLLGTYSLPERLPYLLDALGRAFPGKRSGLRDELLSPAFALVQGICDSVRN